MPPPIEDRRPPITPQLAVRVAVLGGVAFVLFAVIFFRLWFLQVLSGDDYVSQARENRVRKIKIEAPRGNIVDRNGKMLVKTRVAPVVQMLPDRRPRRGDGGRRRLPQGAGRGGGPPARVRAQAARAGAAPARRRPPDARDGEARAAGAADARPTAPRRCRCRRIPAGEAGAALALPAARQGDRRGAAHDPPAGDPGHRRPAVGERDDQDRRPAAAFNYLLEHREAFPGVVVEKKYLRDYPFDELGAQLFGTLREISPDELGTERVPRRQPGHADRQGRDRGDLRQVPARHRRLHAGDRRRERQP